MKFFRIRENGRNITLPSGNLSVNMKKGKSRFSAGSGRGGSVFIVSSPAAAQAYGQEFEWRSSDGYNASGSSGKAGGQNYVLAAYILFGLGVMVQVMPLIGVILAYVKRKDFEDIVYVVHAEYLIKTFWRTLWLYILGALTTAFGIGVLIILAAPVWYFYRVIVGFVRFNDRRMVVPEKWI